MPINQTHTTMENIAFKFQIHQKVVTPFGKEGIITSLVHTKGSNTYWVVMPDEKDERYYAEELLKPAKD